MGIIDNLIEYFCALAVVSFVFVHSVQWYKVNAILL